MSASLEPVDVPESETTPVEEPQISENVETPPDVVEEPQVAIESESKSTISTKGTRSNEAREPISLHHPKGEASIKSQGDENPVKKRGRPRKEVPKEPKTPKAAPKKAVRMKPPSPVNEVNESSSEEETPLTRDDMETLLLDYLVKRKQSQQQARRTMWSQLAGLS